MNRVFILFCTIAILGFLGCTHSPGVIPVVPVAASKTVTPTCATCTSGLICAIVDDIVINSSTVFTACPPQPSGQGSFTADASLCYTWTPNNQTEIVKTCIIACTGAYCDSTYITIYPPVPVDTVPTGNPCVPGVIYFEKDVLPIFNASCAYSGCHNAGSHKEGIILDSYTNVINTGKIKPMRLDNKIIRSITTSDSDDIMPPSPSPKLTTAQINIISEWILQGAKNETCDEGSVTCVTTNVSYSTYVRPTLASCTSCHKTGNAGGGINLDSYAGMKSAADSGRLYGSINWSSSYLAMPQGGAKLPDCTIKKIKGWIDDGAPNN